MSLGGHLGACVGDVLDYVSGNVLLDLLGHFCIWGCFDKKTMGVFWDMFWGCVGDVFGIYLEHFQQHTTTFCKFMQAVAPDL